MTPLAHAIILDSLLPQKARKFSDECGLVPLMREIKCFECTEALEAALTIGWKQNKSREQNNDRLRTMGAVTTFLPAPFTWVEFRGCEIGQWSKEARYGILLTEDEGEIIGRFAIRSSDGKNFGSGLYIFSMLTYSQEYEPGRTIGLFPAFSATASHQIARLQEMGREKEALDSVQRIASLMTPMLSIINTPNIIARVERPAHKGLQRRIGGEFRLRPWTEIKLCVTPDKASAASGTGVLFTGKRALHFCRSYLQINHGKLTLVSAHWRGDPALGIVKAKYKVIRKEPIEAITGLV